MNKEERDKRLTEMAKGIDGECLLDYLKEVMEDLDSVQGITKVEEIIGRQEALKICRKIFGFILSKRKKIITKRNQYT